MEPLHFLFSELGSESGNLPMPGKCFTNYLYPQVQNPNLCMCSFFYPVKSKETDSR